MKKRNLGFVLLPAVLSVGIVGGLFIGKYSGRHAYSPSEEKLRAIMSLIDQNYVDEIDVDSLLDKTFPDLIASLDPHSVYIPKSDLTSVNDELEGSFSGIGVSFQVLNDSVVIVEVVPGGPSEKSGLQAGDVIIKADTTALSGVNVTTEGVYKNLRGPEGSKVKLEVKRSNTGKPLTFDIVRGAVPQLSVDCSYMISPEIGYIRVNKFARNTYAEFRKALTELQNQGARKYIVDLRGNSGGFMDQAIYMANEFLPANKIIVYTKGRNKENETMALSDGNGRFQDAEITVLTNEYSASASEIFAGAIQDNDRGLVIGRRSFGKGLVQNQIMLPDSSALRLTVARYYTPSGRLIQKEYARGKDGKYELDILDRYKHGEFYSADSIKLDKDKISYTGMGRKVYGGGGIMPDIFVPEDTTAYTSYYIEAINSGMVQKFSYHIADKYRSLVGANPTPLDVARVIPRDNTLLNNFVDFGASKGLPARWFYINRSRDLLLNQIKAVITRDLSGYSGFIQVLNETDPVVIRAVKELKAGNSPVVIKNETKK